MKFYEQCTFSMILKKVGLEIAVFLQHMNISKNYLNNINTMVSQLFQYDVNVPYQYSLVNFCQSGSRRERVNFFV